MKEEVNECDRILRFKQSFCRRIKGRPDRVPAQTVPAMFAEPARMTTG